MTIPRFARPLSLGFACLVVAGLFSACKSYSDGPEPYPVKGSVASSPLARPAGGQSARAVVREYTIGKTDVGEFFKDAGFKFDELFNREVRAITTTNGWRVRMHSIGIRLPEGTVVEFGVGDSEGEFVLLEFAADVLTARKYH